MNHATINTCFWISLVVIIPLGVLVMILWAKKIYRRALKRIEDQRIRYGVTSVRTISGIGFIYMIPGVLLFIIFCIPVFYFGNLLKQEDYIVQVIRVNHLNKDSPDLDEYRGTHNIDELYTRAQNEPPPTP